MCLTQIPHPHSSRALQVTNCYVLSTTSQLYRLKVSYCDHRMSVVRQQFPLNNVFCTTWWYFTKLHRNPASKYLMSYCDRWKSVVVCGQHLHERTFPKLLAGFWPNLAGMIYIALFDNCSNDFGQHRLKIDFQDEKFKNVLV